MMLKFLLLFAVSHLQATHALEINNFNQVFQDISDVVDEEKYLITSTQNNMQTCSTLANTENQHSCYNSMRSLFEIMKDDILTRITELNELGSRVLRISEVNMETFSSTNRQFVRDASLETRSELIDCIEGM
jgi:hypothetical protein